MRKYFLASIFLIAPLFGFWSCADEQPSDDPGDVSEALDVEPTPELPSSTPDDTALDADPVEGIDLLSFDPAKDKDDWCEYKCHCYCKCHDGKCKWKCKSDKDKCKKKCKGKSCDKDDDDDDEDDENDEDDEKDDDEKDKK